MAREADRVGRAAPRSRVAWVAAQGALLAGLGGVAHADAPTRDEATVPTVTVKGRRSQAPASNNVTVITADDIAKSPATTVVDLLAAEANLVVQDFYGNDKKAGVDMRGMGATAISNVLIVVDGERLNETDQSGPDLSTLMLSQIERIEVIRGGGSVRHGPGAVGGVIEITTRRPKPGPAQARLGLGVASYGGRTALASVEGGQGDVAARLQAGYQQSDGYRENSAYWSNKLSGELRWTPMVPGGSLDAHVRATLSKDRHGLPGHLPIEVLEGSEQDRRGSRSPFDRGATDDLRVSLGVAYDHTDWGRTSLNYQLRDRRNPYLMGFAPVLGVFSLEEQIKFQMSEIVSNRNEWQLTHEWATTVAGLPQSIVVGSIWGDGGYRRREADLDEPKRDMQGQVRTRAGYVDAKLSPWQGMQVHAGLRWDGMRVDQQRHDESSDAETVRRWGQRSSELGWSWRVTPAWEPFFSISRHIRQPNLDDLASATDDLRPQRGRTREAGLRLEPLSDLRATMSVFDMHIDDEIVYGPTEPGGLSLNRNAPFATHRKGGEAEVRWQVLQSLRVHMQWAYVSPRFVGQGSDVPLVPRRTRNAGVQWQALPGLSWSWNARHVSERFDGNDWANAQRPLKPYTVVDTQIQTETRLGKDTLTWTFGVQNLFDEVYTTKAYSQTVYPMPGRRAFMFLQWAM